MATFVPSLHASTLQADFLLRRSQDAVHAVINDHSVFQAFSDAGHPATVPVEEWRNDSGEVFQSHYQFDTDEWNAMRFELAKRAGIDESVLIMTNLTTRQNSEDPPDFFCTNFNKNPKVYSTTAGLALGGVCQYLVDGGALLGKTQIVRRNVPDVNNRAVVAIFRYTWYNLKWATVSACTVAGSIGLNEACSQPATGNEGEQPATAGFDGKNAEVEIGLEIAAA
ncbi:hypothetical protein CB0940_12165 [Cercospora beticola]|uniref:Uncharacterized protein n=1 Tax=Cercospora beticola TaxID=122368 RepID=A0A2G5GMM5_CERBT|nr:hypothetical protein CB0940_12165 [Cercospora beticola]PIA81332.1 hypothetical protein CB0940_12165 [Cercospora beticola]WPA97559.1 hypothetical protein RHO25_002169 [Cercospora beticola]CAK1358743.1 unnamed protein product [Cercospora beticola]